MRRFTHILISLLTCLVMSAGTPLLTAGQGLQDFSYTTANGIHTIEWNENWTASLQGEDDFSTMLMLESQIMIYIVMFIHEPMTGISTRAIYFSLADVVTSGFDGPPKSSVEWSEGEGNYQGAYIINISGFDFLIFMRVDVPEGEESGPVVQVAGTPVTGFTGGLESMQKDLILDGLPVLNGVDGAEVTNAVETGVPPGGEAEPAPASANADSERGEGGAQERDRSSEPPGSAPEQEQGRSSNSSSGPWDRLVPRASNNAQPADGPGFYQHENPEYLVTWPDVWQNMAITDSTVGQFSLTLNSSTSVIVSFTGRSTTETNRDAYFDDIIAREARYEGFVGSVKSDDRLITATWVNESELTVLEYIFIDDTTVITVMVTIKSPRPENAVPEVQRITLNNQGILRDWSQLWEGEGQ